MVVCMAATMAPLCETAGLYEINKKYLHLYLYIK